MQLTNITHGGEEIHSAGPPAPCHDEGSSFLSQAGIEGGSTLSVSTGVETHRDGYSPIQKSPVEAMQVVWHSCSSTEE